MDSNVEISLISLRRHMNMENIVKDFQRITNNVMEQVSGTYLSTISAQISRQINASI